MVAAVCSGIEVRCAKTPGPRRLEDLAGDRAGCTDSAVPELCEANFGQMLGDPPWDFVLVFSDTNLRCPDAMATALDGQDAEPIDPKSVERARAKAALWVPTQRRTFLARARAEDGAEVEGEAAARLLTSHWRDAFTALGIERAARCGWLEHARL